MGTKFLKEGQDFEYPASFGFSGSAKGPNNPLPHPTQDQDEFGDGTYLAQQSANPPTFARGGRVRKPPHVAPKAAKAVVGALQLGEQIGEKKAALAPAAGAGGPPPTPGAGMAPPVISQGPIQAPPMMACGGPVMRAQGGPADAKPPMNFDGGDHQYDSSAEGAKALAAPAYADGGQVGLKKETGKIWRNAVNPTPRPTFGSDTEEFETSANGLGHQVGEMDSKGNVSFDHGASILAPVDPRGSTNYNKSRVVHMDEIEDPQNFAKGGFIKGAIKHKGALHEDLGVPKGQKIPAGKLAAAAKQPGKVGQRARFAETLKGLNHKKDG